MHADAIGGYFELELPAAGAELHRGALRFQSARAAFLALLRHCRPSAVWMPWYVCDSLLEPLRATNTTIKRYPIDEQFRVVSAPIQPGEWLLYVDYFGLCERNVRDVLNRFPPSQVVIDRSQSFYGAPQACLATIYSPRKFFGVPDGGYLVTDHAIEEPDDTDDLSAIRAKHLLLRMEKGPEAGYADYIAAEESLKGQEPKRMSFLTRRILAGVDYAAIRARRHRNYALLHDRLVGVNGFRFRNQDAEAPLCYPFLGGRQHLRERLRAERIYTPTYWTEVAKQDGVPAVESHLARSALFLPCDQRLTTAQIERIAEFVLTALK